MSAQLDNLTNLQPVEGFDSPNTMHFISLLCDDHDCASLNEVTLSLDAPKVETQCVGCRKPIKIKMKAFGYAFTKEDSDKKEFTPLLQFRCTQGFAPLYYTFDDDWQAEVESTGATVPVVGLSDNKELHHDINDEDGNPIGKIYNLETAFVPKSAWETD
ncbi:hypothetical protein FNV43_RR06727 [Rhamnella rubrinervis]|uniref:Uncharacterized protein n=1 Tax=Rhamnella rubrinervis TaxID=2594499 RepID=A0A8K0MM21_9ROSA|nr:hypothetical protein FNV43_RR06727 [Rhamnella rubrinervis]